MEQKEKSRQSIAFILKCAIDEFAEKGMDFSLNTICKDNSISKGRFYHHFESKDNLLSACVCYSLHHLIDTINAYEVNDSISIKENFHRYYYSIIMHWQQNCNELTVLRYAYSFSNSFFSETALTKIKEHKIMWEQAKREKFLSILHSGHSQLRVNDDNITEIILIMYENTFQILENKMIRAVKNGNKDEIEQSTNDLINYHDAIIDMILYGAIKQ